MQRTVLNAGLNGRDLLLLLGGDIAASAWSEEAKILYDVAEISDWSLEVEEVAKVGGTIGSDLKLSTLPSLGRTPAA